MDTSIIKKQEELMALSATEYLVAIFDTGAIIPITGEEVLHQPGYRDYDWVRSLIDTMRPIIRYLPKPENIDHDAAVGLKMLHALASTSEEELDMLLSRELVATFCLISNILSAMYHEYILYQQLEFLERHKPPTKEERALKKRLKMASSKFRKLKEEFLELAFRGRPSWKDRAHFMVQFVDSGRPTLYGAFVVAPIIYRQCQRHQTTDWTKITKLRRKYRDEVAYCEAIREARECTSLSMAGINFTPTGSGKF